MNISQLVVILNVFASLRISSYCISLILCVHLSPGTEYKRVFQLESCQKRKWLLCFPPISYFHVSAKQWPKHGDERALTNTAWVMKWMNALIVYLSGCVCFMIQFNVKTLENKTRLTEVSQQQVREISLSSASVALRAVCSNWFLLLSKFKRPR